MTNDQPVALLALLVHRGMLSPGVAQQALRSSDARGWLVANGHATAAQWQDWVETEAGTRPRLSRYELGALLGEGGQARVFAAVDRQDHRTVALKVLLDELARDPVARARFVAESKLLIALASPNIVKGYRVAREGDTVFCAMELVDGESLQQALDRDGPFDEGKALDVVRQIAEALACLHDRGLVHRDVKPGNVLLDRGGRAVLIDLGFAATCADGDPSTTTVGTIHYIAPEQARGQQDLDVRADIYSLGATLFHLVTGSLPFSGRTSEEVLAKQVLESLSGERLRALGLSPQLHWFIEKMMAKEKEIRFQDPRTLAREIATVLARRKAEAERDASDASPRGKRPRRRWL
ncbi:MAG: serine/threonine protein kinase [Planctomycetes bacterium]|nr:serine/threonine protein kinase [Planctomycetota bacterium]